MIETRVNGVGDRTFRIVALVGFLCLVAALLSLAPLPDTAYASYLAAFTYWVGIAVGSLLLLTSFHASSARWMVVMRRPLECMAATLPLFAILFIPIAVGLPHVYSWARPGTSLGEGDALLLHQKATEWLTPRLFLLRAASYFVLWIGVAELLWRWSRRQDESPAIEWTSLERRLSAGSLPLLGISMTFAAFDWLMSLSPAWGTTMFGLYWFSGSFLAAHAALIVITVALERSGSLDGAVQAAHYKSIGKLTFAFVVFWAYIAFCQFMLIWIANEPDEVTFYVTRSTNGYLPIAIALVFGKFAVPFLFLLSSDVKVVPRKLFAIACWILVMQFVDIYWLVMPAFPEHGAVPRITDLIALVGIGALAVAFGRWRLRGSRFLPLYDPYLSESLRYSKL